MAAMAARVVLALGATLRLPALAVLSLATGSEQAQTQLNLHRHALAWLLNPLSGLVPEVDRSR